MERDTLNKNLYEVRISFTQEVVGEAIAENENDVEEQLVAHNKDVPDFKILEIRKLGDYNQLSMFETNVVN